MVTMKLEFNGSQDCQTCELGTLGTLEKMMEEVVDKKLAEAIDEKRNKEDVPHQHSLFVSLSMTVCL